MVLEGRGSGCGVSEPRCGVVLGDPSVGWRVCVCVEG